MRLRTVNRLAKSAEQPLRHSVKFDLTFLNSKTYFYPIWMFLDSGPIEYLDKKICDFWRKRQDKIVSMEALENPILCCTYGAQCRKKRYMYFLGIPMNIIHLILSLLYGLPTYSSIRNRRACMFINFEKKFPPSIRPFLGQHVYCFWEKKIPCTFIPSCMCIGICTARLLILRKKSPLHGLILVCTFISFWEKIPPARPYLCLLV